VICHVPNRRAVYLRLSITGRCNLRCGYCRPASPGQDTQRSPSATDGELLKMVRIVHETVSVHKLRLTGGEPLLHPRLADLVAELRKQLPDTAICTTTNGTFLAKQAKELKAAGLDSLNVSLDTLNPRLFKELTGVGSLEATIAGIGAARAAGFKDLKLNAVLIRGINGHSLADLVRFASRADCEIRFIELMPYGHGAALFRTDYFVADEALSALKEEFPYIGPAAHTGTAARHQFFVDGRTITVGFITPVSHPFCAECDRLRLNRSGRLFACLRQQRYVDLLTPLRAGNLATVSQRIMASLCGKHDPGGYWPEHHMVSIGG
jgi:GTP 3',8-cyclase